LATIRPRATSRDAGIGDEQHLFPAEFANQLAQTVHRAAAEDDAGAGIEIERAQRPGLPSGGRIRIGHDNRLRFAEGEPAENQQDGRQGFSEPSSGESLHHTAARRRGAIALP
jgi:hypothetical protein